MHERGIKLVMDLVVNHSSDEHEWFKQSRAPEQILTVTITIGGMQKGENRRTGIVCLM